jgi:hypothetical protein
VNLAILDSSSLRSDLAIASKAFANIYHPEDGAERLDTTQIRRAILETLIYGDLFDYPLTCEEIIRYLPARADPDTIRRLLDEGIEVGTWECTGDLLVLPGRTELGNLRMRRTAIADEKWSVAGRPIRWIARLPFVRMVAVTGSLAVNNVEGLDDVDLFIVTAAKRLWLCRAFVILVVRLAARSSVVICPNYFLSETHLALAQRSFFDARELAQMVPLYGPQFYWQIRSLNPWVEAQLPQAASLPDSHVAWIELSPIERVAKQVFEKFLNGRIGSWLELWEMRRKVRRFNQRAQTQGGRVQFTPECCKGHFDGHGEIIPRRFERRLAQYGLVKEKIDA